MSTASIVVNRMLTRVPWLLQTDYNLSLVEYELVSLSAGGGTAIAAAAAAPVPAPATAEA